MADTYRPYLNRLALLNLLSPPPQPAGCVTATPLLLLLSKNKLSHFLNTDFVDTESKEAAYAVTGENSKHDS